MPTRRHVPFGVLCGVLFFAVPVLGLGLLIVQGIYTRSRRYLTTDDAPDGRDFYGAGRSLRLLVAGDSSAVGVGASSPETGVAGRIAAALAAERGRQVSVSARAVFGARTEHLAGQLADVETLGPDLVVILIGANDALKGVRLTHIRRHMTDAVTRAAAGGAVVVVGTCPYLGSRNFPRPLRGVAGWHGRRVAAVQDEAVSRAGGWPVPLDVFAGPIFRDAPSTMLSIDDFHPSDDGYGVWADALLPTVRTALDRPRSQRPER